MDLPLHWAAPLGGVCGALSLTGELEGVAAVERGLDMEPELPVEFESVFSSPDVSSSESIRNEDYKGSE